MREKIVELLKDVKFPGTSADLVSLKVPSTIELGEDQKSASLVLSIPVPFEDIAWQVKDLVRVALQKALPSLELTLKTETVVPFAKRSQSSIIPGSKIKQYIAVASGKGGVGKSTVSVNLACALAKAGAKVGLLDADVYGPSVPSMFGIKRAMLLTGEDNRVIPMKRYDVELMSIGFMLDNKRKSVLWRGPMLHGVMQQFLEDVAWGDLDYLIMDLPPGTGDVQMSICQLAPISGAVIVSTPQDLALNVAVKAIDLFNALERPIAGLIENMSFYICPKCGERQDIFGTEGTQAMCEEFKVPLLGTLPLEAGVRKYGDKGTPIVLSDPDAASGQAFDQTARCLAIRLAELAVQ